MSAQRTAAEVTVEYEHTALNVADPIATVEWYVQHIAMHIVRQGGVSAHARFLADATGRVILEVYNDRGRPS